MNVEQKNSLWIINCLKKWKAKALQAFSVIKVYQRCANKSETPEEFYNEVQAEQIINKYDI